MNRTAIWRLISLVVVFTMLLALVPGFAGAQDPAAKREKRVLTEHSGMAAPAVAPAQARTGAAPPAENYLDKLHPDLQELLAAASPALPADAGPLAKPAADQPILIEIYASVDLKPGQEEPDLVDRLRPYFVEGQIYAQPALGKEASRLQILFGRILPSNLLKVAAYGSVVQIYPIQIQRQEYDDYPADDPRAEAKPGPDDWAKLRENADALREGSRPWSEAKAFGDGREQPAPSDWFEVSSEGPHKAESAWARGYNGEGVTLAVQDMGVDFAHPDLMGTQKIYSGTWSLDPDLPSPYNGWPYAFDPFTMRAYAYDVLFGETYVSGGFEGVTYFDTSATPPLTPVGSGVSTFDYTPLIADSTPGIPHTYIISDDMTASGVVHVGTHHDGSLRDFVWGERVAVLVGDPNVAGVYDTVWVDLDDDYDFRDEKPVTRADPTNPATFNNPISYRDMDFDGLADLNGGLLYFIADGVNYIPGSDWLWGGLIPPPGNGDLIAMHGPWDTGYSHGQLCASNAVGQGVSDGMLPEFSDLPPGPGKPAAAVYGMAPGAKMTAMNDAWNFSSRSNTIDGYFFLAVGWDANDQTGFNFLYGPSFPDTDTITASSHSYGWSGDYDQGYDWVGQVVAELQHNWAPYHQFLFSTGNGGPGYGTVAPPSPATAIAVGASTQYGATGWDSITETMQINFNDLASFSNSGPDARGGAGVDVVAGGAYAAGAEELNFFSPAYYGILDGNVSWDDWGGTSRSAPVALGIYALMAQAYKDEHGTWPTYEQGKALLMSTANDINYDMFKQGAGSVDGDRVTQVASGEYGVYMDGDSASWEPGDYRGSDYPAFGHIVYPGDIWNKSFTVVNDGPDAVTVDISDTYLQLIDYKEFDYTVTAAMAAAENADNFGKGFHYFIPITAEVGMDPMWYVNDIAIPPEADLMCIRERFPHDEFDSDGDYAWNNRFYLVVYNWMDEDDDGIVWDDKDGNDVVNFVNGPYLGPDGLKIGPELDWDNPITELDRWEYGRFGYNRPSGNTMELCVHDPLERMQDGIFIGPRHLTGDGGYAGDTHLAFRVEFYQKADAGWLTTDANNVSVPSGGTATFQGTVNVPGDMPPGDYSAAIEVVDPGPLGGEAHTTVIPVAINVAADFDDLVAGETLAGWEAQNYDEAAGRAYNNGMVRGAQDWGWREETGDWRFFYFDLDNEPVTTTLFSESFDAGIPGTWTVVDNTSSGLVWQAGSLCAYANETGGAGDFADANSDCFGSATFDTELWTPAIDLSTASTPILEFKSAYENYGGNDSARVWASGDGGSNWDLLLDWNEDHSGPQTIQLPLTAYAGSPNVIISFQYDSNGFNDWYWYWQVDDVEVFEGVYPYDPTAQVMVRDVWEEPAPWTDIDTVVLGPAPSRMTNVAFGAYAGNFYDPSFYGPYTLGIVGQSAVDKAGRSIWRFTNTSGANEEWVTFPIQDGLHELLQHNVLFEGDQFGVVYTKTLGLLTEDVHSFAIETYLDEGVVGTFTLESTMDLNGLVVESYLSEVDREFFDDEPVDFVSSGTIEWAHPFGVEDGISIELTTSSADIADIDLYLFYYGAGGWEQRGVSAGADANEHILYTNPEDGTWLVGINNWSGPAGHFDLTKVVATRAGGIEVTGLPPGPVPANTPVALTIHYDKEMEPGTYPGAVLVGPPEAPQLKEVLFTITKLAPSLDIMKEVDQELAYPGNELNYTIDLFNLGGWMGDFSFVDPIPDHTTFVDASMSCFYVPAMSESFEDAWPPADWNEYQLGAATVGWAQGAAGGSGMYLDPGPHSGTYMAWHNDENAACDSWLVTPQISVPAGGGRLRFWQAVGWPTFYDHDSVQVTTDADPDPSVATYTELWNGSAGGSWSEQGIDLGAYAGQDVYLAFRYEGDFAHEWYLDDVAVDGLVCPAVNYDSVQDEISYVGPLPPGMAFLPASPEGFEDGVMPPPGWDVDNVVGPGWEIVDAAGYPDWVHSGDYAALAYWDGNEDIWLYSAWFTVDAVANDLSFWARSATQVGSDIVDGQEVDLYVIDEDNVATLIWDMQAEETWDDFAYRQVTKSLAAFAGQNVRLAWNYYEGPWTGYKGVFILDDVEFGGTVLPVQQPSGTINLTVQVDDPVAVGTEIVNTGTLDYEHVALGQTESYSDDAVSIVASEPNFATSYKLATEEVYLGGEIEYEVHVINTGDTMADIVFSDPIPAGTTYLWHDDAMPTHHFTYDAGLNEMRWEGSVLPGAEWVFTFGVRVDDELPPGLTDIENVATIAWDEQAEQVTASTEVLFVYYLPIIMHDSGE